MSSTVLVIDDDPSIVHLLKEDLEAEGYKVLEGYDGQMALQLAKSSKPHLIIMDVNMPMINGLEGLGTFTRTAGYEKYSHPFSERRGVLRVAPALESAGRVAHVKNPSIWMT